MEQPIPSPPIQNQFVKYSARILHDFVRSPFTGLTPYDRRMLRGFYQRIMRFGMPIAEPTESGLLRMFKPARKDSSMQMALWGDPRHVTLGALLPDLDRVLASLDKN